MAVAASRSLFAALLLLGGCTSIHATDATFEDTRWQVTAIGGQPVPRSDSYRLSFADGRIGGRFGCNSFGGPYQVSGESVVVGDIATTLIGCPEPAATHEAKALSVLGAPTRIDWSSGNRLTLRNARGSIALERIP